MHKLADSYLKDALFSRNAERRRDAQKRLDAQIAEYAKMTSH